MDLGKSKAKCSDGDDEDEDARINVAANSCSGDCDSKKPDFNPIVNSHADDEILIEALVKLPSTVDNTDSDSYAAAVTNANTQNEVYVAADFAATVSSGVNGFAACDFEGIATTEAETDVEIKAKTELSAGVVSMFSEIDADVHFMYEN